MSATNDGPKHYIPFTSGIHSEKTTKISVKLKELGIADETLLTDLHEIYTQKKRAVDDSQQKLLKAQVEEADKQQEVQRLLVVFV